MKVSTGPVQPILHAETQMEFVGKGKYTLEEKKIYCDLIFYMNFSWEEKILTQDSRRLKYSGKSAFL